MAEEELENPFEGFDPRVQQAVEGLIYLGYLERTVEFCGHTFQFRTLRPNESFAVAQVQKSHQDTIKAAEAYACGHVSMALMSVDGDENFCPAIGPDLTAFAQARFTYVAGKWYQTTIDYLFSEYITLEREALRATRRIMDLSAKSPLMSSPSADSWIEPGTSIGSAPMANL